MLMMVLRLNRSATCPTTSVSRTMGKNCTRPTIPRAKVLWVSAYICQPTATAAIWNEMVEHIRANQNRIYLDSRNSDWVSLCGSWLGLALLVYVHMQSRQSSSQPTLHGK